MVSIHVIVCTGFLFYMIGNGNAMLSGLQHNMQVYVMPSMGTHIVSIASTSTSGTKVNTCPCIDPETKQFLYPPISKLPDYVVSEAWRNVKYQFDEFLEIHPDLKMSSSKYISLKVASVIDPISKTLKYKSPVVRDISTFYSSFRSAMNANYGDGGALLLTNSVDAVNNFINDALTSSKHVGSLLYEVPFKRVNSYLDDHPDLKLPTSVFLSNYFSHTVLPNLVETFETVSNAPLGSSIKRIISIKPEQALLSLHQRGMHLLVSTADNLGDVGADLLKTAKKNVFKDSPQAPPTQLFFVNSKSRLSSSDISYSIQSGNQNSDAVRDKYRTLPYKWQRIQHRAEVITSTAFNALQSGVQQVTDEVSSVATNALPALGKAGAHLAGDFSDAASVLARNTVFAAVATAHAIGDIVRGVIVDIPARAADIAVQKVASLPTVQAQIMDQFGHVLSGGEQEVERVATQITKQTEAVQRWRLFSDESHLESGFWERQIARGSDLAVTLKDPDGAAEYRAQLAKSAKELLQRAGRRFVELFYHRVKSFTRETGTERFVRTVHNKVVQTAEKVAKVIRFATLFAAKGLQSFLEDTRNYVNDFILSNEDTSY